MKHQICQPSHAVNSDDRIARITVRHGSATVDCSDAAMLAPLLSCQTVAFEVAGPLGHAAHLETIPFHRFDLLGRLVVREGMVPLVTAALEARGWVVDITDLRRFDGPAFATDSAIKQAVDREDDFLRIIDREPVGLLRYDTIDNLANWMALIIGFYPQAHVLILTATRSRAWHLRKKIWEHLPRHIQLAAGTWRKQARIVAATYTYVDDPRAWDIIFFPDAEQLGNDGVIDKLNTLVPHGIKRIYAFVNHRSSLSCRQAMAITAIAGPAIYPVIPRLADVHVMWLPVPDVHAGSLRGLDYKRAYWTCERRNKLIAEVASVAAAGDLQRLHRHGLFVDLAAAPATPWRVVVLVESPEHGRELQRRLTGWALRTLVPGQKLAAAGDVHSDGDAGAAGIIVTVAYALRHGLAADVLIRVDGGGPIEFPGFPPAADSVDGGVYLIDLADDTDQPARREARRRLADYMSRGWNIEGRHRKIEPPLRPHAPEGTPIAIANP